MRLLIIDLICIVCTTESTLHRLVLYEIVNIQFLAITFSSKFFFGKKDKKFCTKLWTTTSSCSWCTPLSFAVKWRAYWTGRSSCGVSTSGNWKTDRKTYVFEICTILWPARLRVYDDTRTCILPSCRVTTQDNLPYSSLRTDTCTLWWADSNFESPVGLVLSFSWRG